MAAIDEVLSKAQLSADERKLLDNILSKPENKELRDGWERQGDYSRKTAALAAERQKYETAIEYNDRMKQWADTHVPLYDEALEAGMFDEDGKPVWKAKTEEYERQIADLKTQSVGGEVDAAELQKRVTAIVKEAGALTRDEVNNLIASETVKLARETVTGEYEKQKKDFNEKTIPYLVGFGAQYNGATSKYERETGEEWTEEKDNEFASFMNKEQDWKPRSAMAKFMAPHLEKKTRQAEIEAAAEKRAQELIRQRGGMPGAGGEAYIPQDGDKEPGMGSLARMLKASEGEPMDTEAAAQIAAKQAAQELRSEGKW